MHWRIRTQTVFLSLVPLFFLGVLFIVAFAMLNATLDLAAWNQRSVQIIGEDELVTRTLSQVSESVNAYVGDRSYTRLAGYRSGMSAIPRELATLARLAAAEARERKPVAAFTSDMNAGLVVLRTYVRDEERRDARAAKALAAAPSTRRLSGALGQDAAAVSNVQRAITLQRLTASRRTQQSYGVALLIWCLVGIVCTLGTAWAFGFRVVGRLRNLATNARRLAIGDEPIPIHGSDEIAELNNVYLEMTRRIQQEHQIAVTLQRALLPSEMPVVDGLRIDTAYMPAYREAEVGGDWYDVFVLSESCIGISVGDVAGHGLKAASVMGTMRHAIRTAARIDPDAARVLEHVNRALLNDYDDTVVTAFFGILDLEDGLLRYAVAGHPAPLVMWNDGRIERIDASGLILGVDPRARFDTFELELSAGCGLVLFTDGIIEVERNYEKGMHDLETTLREVYDAPSSNIAEAIQQRIFEHAPPRDDSAVLVLRVLHLTPGVTTSKTWRIDTAQPAATRRVKHDVIEELRTSSDGDFSGVELILGELLSNVARHTPGMADVTLEWRDGDALLHIFDRGAPFSINGRTRPDLLQEGGRGLFLVSSISGGVNVERTGSGNHVIAVLPVSRSARAV